MLFRVLAALAAFRTSAVLAQQTVCAEAVEHVTTTLACPAGRRIAVITFASYGTPVRAGTTACSYSTGYCDVRNSESIVAAACVGDESCSIFASNTVFGDPCFGVVKRAFVSATCSPKCNPPDEPNSSFANIGGYTWRWYCDPGFYGPNVDRFCNLDGTWSGTPIRCLPCPIGRYCVGAGAGPQFCNAGYFGAVQALSSPRCSGCCTAGYRCNAGSTSPTQFRCGGIGQLYCPRCTSTALVVTSGYVTTPIDGALDLRSGQAPCPSGYSCTGGLLDPAILLTGVCASGFCDAYVSEQQSFLSIPPGIAVSTPGYTGGVAWTITDIYSPNPVCDPTASPIDLFVDPLTQRAAQIYVRSSLPFIRCSGGFSVAITAARTSTNESVTAVVAVSVTQRILPPVIAECNARSVLERQPAGTAVGPRLSASTVNTGTTLRWSLSPSSSYVQIDSCTGQISTLQVLQYATWAGATFAVTVTNDGSSLGLGSQTSNCSILIRVTPVNDPPVISTRKLLVPELTPAGTVVGRILASDPNGDALSGWAWVSRDPRDPSAFAISPTNGDVTVTKLLDTTVTLTTLYSYVVSVSDGRLTTTSPIDVSIQVVYRPPFVASNQVRSIREGAASGTRMPPALIASHPQQLPLSFFIDDPSDTFSVDVNTGVMFLLPNRTLDFLVRASYPVILRVVDSQGGQAQANVVCNVLEVNRPPYFPSTSVFLVDAMPGARSGDLLALTLNARDFNTGDTLTYLLRASDPPVGLSMFTLDALSGRLAYAAGLPNNTYSHPWTAVFRAPATFLLNFTVIDSGTPRMAVNGSIQVLSYGVSPLVLAQTFVLPASAVAGTAFASVVARSAYSQANLGFSLVSCDRTPSNQAPFVLSASGVLSVATPQPTWNYNVQPSITCRVSVSDTAPHTGLSAATVTVQLSHVNRPPVWRQIPTLFTSAARSASIGPPLTGFVDDPDTLLAVGESLSFAIIGGNTDSTLGIDPVNGQIYVANNATAAIQYNGGANAFNLQVNVTDAGVDGPAGWAVTAIRIQVVYANNAPGPLLGPFKFSVVEHLPAGAVVGYFDATDFDASDLLTFSITPSGANVNQPFALNVSTVPGGPFGRNRGMITIVDDGWWPEAGVTYRRPMDWNLKFRRYEATIAVTDVTLTPLTATAGVVVDVQLASEPPYFNANTRIPGSGVFNVSMPEHSAPNIVIAAAGVVTARHKDPWQVPNLRYALDVTSPGCASSSASGVPYASIFSVDAISGALSLAPFAPDLSFNAQPVFRMCLRATDNMSRADVAQVSVAIEDINEPAVWRGVSTDAAGMALVPSLTVDELAAVGTIIGFLQATDADRSPRWGARKFALLPTDDARFFAVDADSGAVSVGALGLNAWDQRRFLLNVTVQDTDPLAPIVVPFAFSAIVAQASRLRLASIAVPSGTAAGTAVNVSSSPFAATHVNMGVLITTRGGAPVWLAGSFLGPTSRRLTNDGRTLADVAVRATYGPTGLEYAASGCAVIQASTLIECAGTAEGVGASHVWNVSLSYAGGPWWWAPVNAAVLSGYLPPRVVSVIRTGAPAVFAANEVATTGGNTVDVACGDCGPSLAGNRVTLDYGRRAGEYAAAAPCFWLASQSLVRCTLSPGIGGPSLLWRLTVGAQTSSVFSGSLVHYAPPTISSVAMSTLSGLLSTAGGDVDGIVVAGTSFGPAGTTDIVLQYSMSASNPAYTMHSAIACRSTSHTRIVCTSAPGVGFALRVRVTVGGQVSGMTGQGGGGGALVGQVLSYTPPALTGISGFGASNADTLGGQTVVLSGRNFGPVTQLNSVGRPVSAVMAPSAFYGPPVLAANLPYAAANCFVSVADTQAICTTVEGVGAGLVWRIVLGEQPSPTVANLTTSYHPPIVTSYSGAYGVEVSSMQTFGGEVVFVNGRHFGPVGTPVDSALYSAASGTVFTAENCSVIRAHDLVQCNTAVGAGAGLLWRLTIGRQVSVAPTTAYGVPIIDSINGPGAADASTDGGELVILTGRYFSVQQFLEGVTYGVSGTEYTATDCRVTANHTEIRCLTAPGTGRKLSWMVRVQGQTSTRSGITTSYEAPVITSITPVSGATDGNFRAIISGTGFAFAFKAAAAVVRWNAVGSPQPSGAAIAAHYASVYAGGTGEPGVVRWMAQLPAVQPIKANRSFEITVPEGFGANREVFVVVDGVPSNIASFTYAPPTITNVAPDRQNVTRGNLRVVIEGRSFCSGRATPELPDGCGFVAINGVRRAARQWGHSVIEVEMEDLTQVLRGQQVPAVVTVNGVDSNAFYFLKPVPSIDKLVTQGVYESVSTQGGDRVQVRGVQNLVGERYEDIKLLVRTYAGFAACTNLSMWVDNRLRPTDPAATFTLECSAPAGVGANCPIIVSSIGGNSTESEAVRISYAKPNVASMWLAAPFYSAAARAAALSMSPAQLAAAACLTGSPGPSRPPTENDFLRRRLAITMGVPTLGAQLLLDGSDFGLPEHDPSPLLTIINGMLLNLQWQNYTRLMAVIPPGDGAGYALRFTVGVQDSNMLPFSYAAPTVFRSVPSDGPSSGGVPLTIHGVNFGTSLPDVRIGNRTCALASEMFAGGGTAGTDTFVPSANHSVIKCILPPGQGRQLPIAVTVNEQTSTLPTATFSYVPPEVVSIAPNHGPTSGRTAGVFVDEARVFTRPGDRIVMVLRGRNLGRWGEISFEPTAQSGPGSEPIAVPASSVLPVTGLRALLTRLGGTAGPSVHMGAHVDSIAGMNVSDGDVAAWEAQAMAEANATRAAGGISGVPWASNAAFWDVDRAWNDTTVVFLMPAGFGDVLRVNVTAGQPGTSSALFSYDPPLVTRIIHRDYDNVLLKGCVPQWENATVHPDAVQRGVQPRLKKVFPPCYPTAGNFVVIIIGSGFGPARSSASAQRPTVVLFGDRVCTQLADTKTINFYDDSRQLSAFEVTPDTNHLFCLAPPGIGVNIPVVVNVAGRVSPVTNASRFSYDPPQIEYFTPSNPDAVLSGVRLGISGRNYGDDEPADVRAPEGTRRPIGRVLINDLECDRPLWITARYIVCKSASDTVGAKNVSLFLDSNATGYALPPEPALVYDVEEKLIYTCTKGYYGLEGERCVPCPRGGSCPGGERFTDMLTAETGFWRFNATLGSETADIFCDEERKLTQVPSRSGTCPALRPCEPPLACLADNLCSMGYEGERCAFCLAGKYYRVNGECVKCPENLALLYAGVAAAMLLFGAFAYMLNKRNISLALIAIGVDYFQIVSLFARARIRWPDELKFLLNILSVFNLNIEIVAPECLSATITYGDKWVFIEVLPLTLTGVFLVIHLLKMLYKYCCTSKTKKQLTAHLPTLVSTLIVVIRVLYLYLTKTSMDALSCLTTTPPEFRDKAKTDAITYMAGQLDYPCWVHGSKQLVFFPLGLFALLFYSIGVPAAAFLWLRRNRNAVKTDQILRCKDTGHDQLTNPHYYRWRKMWSKLYIHYKPGKWYWEIVITSRKFLFALTGLMFRQVGAYQLSMALLVLFLAFVLHTQHLPYLTHRNREAVVQEHLAKAVAGDPLHASIEADMLEVEKKNTRKRQKLNVFQSIVAARERKDSMAVLVVLWIFDANTVEAILLASAILVNLSGVMFDSARFAGDNYFVNLQEYKALAYSAILLISATIVYYVLTLLLELTVAFCPHRINSIVSCATCCCRAATRRKLREAELKVKTSGTGGGPAAHGLTQRLSRLSLAGGLSVNPFVLKQQQAAAAAAAAGDSAGDAFLREIMSMEAPSGPAWRLVQDSYQSMAQTLQEMQAELRLLKREAAATRGGGGAGVLTPVARLRTQFKPMHRGDADADADADPRAFAVAASSGVSAASPRSAVSASSASASGRRATAAGVSSPLAPASSSASGLEMTAVAHSLRGYHRAGPGASIFPLSRKARRATAKLLADDADAVAEELPEVELRPDAQSPPLALEGGHSGHADSDHHDGADGTGSTSSAERRVSRGAVSRPLSFTRSDRQPLTTAAAATSHARTSSKDT